MLEYIGNVRTRDDRPANCGRIRIWKFDFRQAENAGHEAFELLDCHNQSSADYSELLNSRAAYEQGGEFWSKATLAALQTSLVAYSNLLVIDRLEILPKFRGRLLGLQAMALAVQNLADGCGVVAIKPFPLQCEPKHFAEFGTSWSDRMELSALSTNKKNGIQSLRKYYAKLGFVPVKGTDFMVFDPERELSSIGSD